MSVRLVNPEIDIQDPNIKAGIGNLLKHSIERDGRENFLGDDENLPTVNSFFNNSKNAIKKIIALDEKNLVIGICTVRLYKGETATLEMLKVGPKDTKESPKMLRRGVGTKIMHFVEELVFVQESKKELRLSVENKNVVAKMFYEHLGWRKDDNRQKTHKYLTEQCYSLRKDGQAFSTPAPTEKKRKRGAKDQSDD